VLEILFWLAVGLLVYTHVGYPLLLRALVALRGRSQATPPPLADADLPRLSLIVAAHDEESVIAARVQNALALDYPRERLEVIVASDGSSDRTAELAREAGADVVLELPHEGKVATLNAAVERAGGDVFAFSDANSAWEPDAARRLTERLLSNDEIGYVCGQVRFSGRESENREGLYWRYEMSVRALESDLAGITGGNGAINAVRRENYLFLEPERGQDITVPFRTVKAGRRPVYEPKAVAQERLAATLGDEFTRKRRMHAGAWATMLTGGMLSPRGYGPMYWLEIASHRLLRYASPFLHLAAFVTNLFLLGEGWIYVATLAAQLALLAFALLAPLVPLWPFRVARYYLSVTAASALGLWDYLRRGVPVTWQKAEGTR
jgi:cellulose synthase/poly-beta-1,6-N-acetylglucosamine synthase-like glycosyltransferase